MEAAPRQSLVTYSRHNRVIGRYVLCDAVATGGMASVHLGRLLGPVGFARTVAIKRLHEQFARDPEFVSMFLDEARVAARIRHPNVVSVLDVVALEGELFLVMDYVQGESLSSLLATMREREERVPLRVASSILGGMLAGLHAAHEARGERGLPLEIVHRDVSPQNLLVGIDGTARVVDFGIAKAAGRAHQTRDGAIKGKLRYMAPEQVLGATLDRRADIYAACIVLWQVLVGRRPFSDDDSDASIMYKVLEGKIDPPSKLVSGLPAGFDAVIARGLARKPEDRYATALDLADAIDRVVPPATAREVSAWINSVAETKLRAREQLIATVECASDEGRPMNTLLSRSREEEPTRVETGFDSVMTTPPIPRTRQLPMVIAGVVLVAGAAAIAASLMKSSLGDHREVAVREASPPLHRIASAAVPPAEEDAVVPAPPATSSARALPPARSTSPRSRKKSEYGFLTTHHPRRPDSRASVSTAFRTKAAAARRA